MSAQAVSEQQPGRGPYSEVAMAADIHPAEPLCRYLLSKSQFRVQKGEVKGSAFMPPPSLALSVFRTQGLAEPEVWDLGRQYVASPQGRTMHGRADVVAEAVQDAGLRVDADDDPPRHANIVGWPGEKHAQKIVAHALALRAKLSLPLV